VVVLVSPSASVAVATSSSLPGAPALRRAVPVLSRATGRPLTVRLRVAIGAKLLARTCTTTGWPGTAAKLGVCSIVTLGAAGARLARSTSGSVVDNSPSETVTRTSESPAWPTLASIR
jgi:hypothetical protein